jgi:hypothetical protein
MVFVLCVGCDELKLITRRGLERWWIFCFMRTLHAAMCMSVWGKVNHAKLKCYARIVKHKTNSTTREREKENKNINS